MGTFLISTGSLTGNVKGTSCDTRLSTPASDPASTLIFFSEAILMLGPSILQRKKSNKVMVLCINYNVPFHDP